MRKLLTIFNLLLSLTLFGQYSEFTNFDSPKPVSQSYVQNKGAIIKREGVTVLNQSLELGDIDPSFVEKSFYDFIEPHKVKSKLSMSNIKSAIKSNSICVFISELSSSNLDLVFKVEKSLTVTFTISQNNVVKEGVITESNSFLMKFQEKLKLDILNYEERKTQDKLDKLQREEARLRSDIESSKKNITKAEKAIYTSKNDIISAENRLKIIESDKSNIKAQLNQIQLKKINIGE